MVTISLCLIVRNEEAVLERLLESVTGVFDEIIIVDTGSTDKTREIAMQYTPDVYDYTWNDDFAAARNFSFSKATMDYWMWMDADDVLEPGDRDELLDLKRVMNKETDTVMMRYNVAFDKSGNPTMSYMRERIIKRCGELPWLGAVHEVIVPRGIILYSNIAISHKKLGPGDPDRNLRIYEKQLAEGKVLDARGKYYYARELYYHARYSDAAEMFREFMAMDTAWQENLIEACQILARCLYAQKQDEMALDALFHSFCYDIPRAEICCDIGKHFFDRQRYQTAIYWYEQAKAQTLTSAAKGFRSPECYDYIPNIQLCMCYYKEGDLARAEQYNEKAGEIRPDSKSYLHNKKFFESLYTS